MRMNRSLRLDTDTTILIPLLSPHTDTAADTPRVTLDHLKYILHCKTVRTLLYTIEQHANSAWWRASSIWPLASLKTTPVCPWLAWPDRSSFNPSVLAFRPLPNVLRMRSDPNPSHEQWQQIRSICPENPISEIEQIQIGTKWALHTLAQPVRKSLQLHFHSWRHSQYTQVYCTLIPSQFWLAELIQNRKTALSFRIFHECVVCANDGNQVVRFQGAARSALIGIWCDPLLLRLTLAQWLPALQQIRTFWGENPIWNLDRSWRNDKKPKEKQIRNSTRQSKEKGGRVSRTCVQWLTWVTLHTPYTNWPLPPGPPWHNKLFRNILQRTLPRHL